MSKPPELRGLGQPDWKKLLPDAQDVESATGHWAEIVAELQSQQKLADVNGHAISRLVVARITYEQAARRVMKDGAIIEAPKTKVLMQHPALSIMNKQAEICAQLEAELTLSPRKRATGGKVAAGRKTQGGKPGGAVDL